MEVISGKKGRELLDSIIQELRMLDPRIVPFDSDDVQALEYGVVQAVRDVFGSGSPEYAEFEDFRIALGHISRGDTRAEKQSKYEMGIPRAIERLEGLLALMGDPEPGEKEAPGFSLKEPAVSRPKAPSPASPPAGEPKPAGKNTADPAQAPRPAARPQPKAEAKPAAEAGGRPGPAEGSPGRSQPGRVLLVEEGGSEITVALSALMKKIGIEVVPLGERFSSEMEGLTDLKNIAFAVMCVSSGPRSGLSGLTSVIGKPHPRHEATFKLGLLVGLLGPGRVVILHGGERPQDIPEGLFGIRYVPYKEEGGWQIGLLKLLKAGGFFIDANLLFD